MSTVVTKDEADRVSEALAAAERTTSGEIIAMITEDSDSYTYAPLLWAALAALLLPWPFIQWTWWPVHHIYLMQIVLFFVLALLLHWRPVRYRLVPRRVKFAHAHRRAVEQFLAQNMHTTAGRTGVLLFVSVAERYVEVLADSGIHKMVPDTEWQAIVDKLTIDIGDGAAGDGLAAAVTAIGERLARHFPPGSAAANQLPNHLIVLPAIS